MFVRAVGKNSGESDRLIQESIAVGSVEDYLSIKDNWSRKSALSRMTVTWFLGYIVQLYNMPEAEFSEYLLN